MTMSSLRSLVSRRAFLHAVLAASLGLLAFAGSIRAAEPLNVVLIAGVKNDAYDNEPSLKKAQAFLEKNYNVKCTWVTPGADGKSFKNLEALDKADTAILFVRRMTIPADQLAKIVLEVAGGGPAVQAKRDHVQGHHKTWDQAWDAKVRLVVKDAAGSPSS